MSQFLPDTHCDQTVLIANHYVTPKAQVAAMQAASYRALARTTVEPSAQVAALCPRAAHYEHLAIIWDQTAEFFNTAKPGPDPSSAPSWPD